MKIKREIKTYIVLNEQELAMLSTILNGVTGGVTGERYIPLRRFAVDLFQAIGADPIYDGCIASYMTLKDEL